MKHKLSSLSLSVWTWLLACTQQIHLKTFTLLLLLLLLNLSLSNPPSPSVAHPLPRRHPPQTDGLSMECLLLSPAAPEASGLSLSLSLSLSIKLKYSDVCLCVNRRAIVEELVCLGAKVHTCARNETELEESLRGWNRSGFQVDGSVCDVSDRAQRQNLMDTVSSLFHGKLHILVRR